MTLFSTLSIYFVSLSKLVKYCFGATYSNQFYLFYRCMLNCCIQSVLHVIHKHYCYKSRYYFCRYFSAVSTEPYRIFMFIILLTSERFLFTKSLTHLTLDSCTHFPITFQFVLVVFYHKQFRYLILKDRIDHEASSVSLSCA